MGSNGRRPTLHENRQTLNVKSQMSCRHPNVTAMAMLQLVTLRYGTTAMAVLQGTTMWRSNDGSATGCDAAVLLQGVTLQ